VVWRVDQIGHSGDAGADVFDLPCAYAQRLFPTVKKNKRREKILPPPLEISDCQLPIADF
jgi:hypothetical protein